jgi:serine/threonine-protein kinase RsbW
MEIWDQGVFFDLEAELKSLRENPPDPLKDEHRRGLIFMKQLTDELEYSRDGQERNCLKMLKKLDFCNSSFNQSSS